MGRIVYLDNNATTKPLDAVVEAMVRCLSEGYANPSSVHGFGQAVRHQVERAREKVAALIGAEPKEMVFTSGGTESINLAIRGTLESRPGRRHVLTSAVEHSAVHQLAKRLVEEGHEVEVLGVDGEGVLDPAAVADRIREDTALVSVMQANNETGVLFDVDGIAEVCAERGVPLHVDAVQAVGKVPVDVTRWPVTLLSMSAHKFHGPKGVGALYVRRRTRLEPLIVGGSQERQRRAGTENVAGIVGMGVAAEAAMNRTEEDRRRVSRLRDRLEERLLASVPTARVMGTGARRIGNTANIAFEGLEAEAILILLSEQGICASSGAACSSGSLEPSHVLKAMGIDDRIAHGAIRFSLSSFNTDEEVDFVAGVMPSIVSRLGALSRS